MSKTKKQKSVVTNESLARMVAKGFTDINERMATKEDVKRLEAKLETRMDGLEKKLEILTETVSDIANKLAHYIDLHEERYLDLKHRYKLLTRWAEKVASKTGIPLDIPSDF